ncbi:MAG: hypothetical protein JOZ99_06450 [Actinobacteria bacterium]|nr:hypothetical protein [Actinomycetota bacterium]
MKAGVPVVPVAIAGSEAIMPSGKAMIRPRKVVLVVGERITPAPGTSSGPARKREVEVVTEALGTALQALLDEAFAVLDRR